MISRYHFTLKRFQPEIPERFQMRPVIITVLGQNGLFINKKKLNVGDSKILLDGDRISLYCNHEGELFRFNYKENAHVPHIHEMKKYFTGDRIGKGGNGQVFLLYETDPVNGNFGTSALKVIEKRHVHTLNADRFNEKLMSEVNVMSRMKYLHVMGLVDYISTPEHLLIISEYMGGGDLCLRIRNSPGGRLTENDSKFFFHQILLGLQYMHNQGIAHRDIKGDNILLKDCSESPCLKLTDFGLSKFLQTENTICGNILE